MAYIPVEKISFDAMSFKPEEGWRNETDFPNDYETTTMVREKLQLLFDQLRDYINTEINAKLSSTDGAAYIGSGPLYTGDNASNVMDKLLKIREEVLAITINQIPNSSITAEKLQAESVSTDKIVNGSVTNSKIANGTIEISKLSAAAQTALSQSGKCKEKGSSTFNSVGGRTVTLSQTYSDSNYAVCVTSTSNTAGRLGEVWVANKTATSFVVYNSGSTTGSSFDYAVFVS